MPNYTIEGRISSAPKMLINTGHATIPGDRVVKKSEKVL